MCAHPPHFTIRCRNRGVSPRDGGQAPDISTLQKAIKGSKSFWGDCHVMSVLCERLDMNALVMQVVREDEGKDERKMTFSVI